MKDLFSGHSGEYAAFRPTYPKELYDFILAHVHGRDSVWDCGCGNGQVANDLATHFKQVHATDISKEQIEKALLRKNISYLVSPAEHSPFKDSCFDLITVGQALHWFDIPAFYNEVQRVAKPNAMLAVWGYGLLSINSDINGHILHFYKDIIGPYWDAERRMVDDQYRSIPFPFPELNTPPFHFSFSWTLQQLSGYLTTWSAVQRYIRQQGVNPVIHFIDEIRPLWTGSEMNVTFPLFLRMGRLRSMD